ncbi:hypothetical protein LNP74_22125 [Klebsiella pneumoniae subsp. pneumoniae]|nr:hypothetical protein [Klebsiella pneumoniae subsp. pneumoniae]
MKPRDAPGIIKGQTADPAILHLVSSMRRHLRDQINILHGSRRKWLPAGREPPASGDMVEADQAFGENLARNVNEAHKYVLLLDAARHAAYYSGFAF